MRGKSPVDYNEVEVFPSLQHDIKPDASALSSASIDSGFDASCKDLSKEQSVIQLGVRLSLWVDPRVCTC